MNRKKICRKVIYRKKVIILLVQIVNRNLGDSIIADNAAYLVQRALPLLGRSHYVLQRYDIRSEDYEMVKTADLIIFAGGGLVKFRQEHFHTYVPDLLACAESCGIPVFFNSVGVEGYDREDAGCMRLVQALNYNCVKGITVRDDLETLRSSYVYAGHVLTAAAVDTAVFTPDVYGVRKDTYSNTIGLGIVRYRIFEDYGIPQVTRSVQLELWKGIAEALEARGYQWKLFVNGLKSDYEFAQEVLAYMGREAQADRLLAVRPTESRELVDTIASFAGVIACRMHANIVAYALGIPSVGLVWNDKMLYWGRRIDYPERFLCSGEFEPRKVVECLLDSIRQGVRPCSRAWKKSIQKPLQEFVSRYGRPAWKKNRAVCDTKPIKWADRLVATALGGLHRLYVNMNTPAALEASLNEGFRNLEADIRLTSDGRLVCVNGWSKASYEKLGIDPAAYDDRGMDYAAFMACRMYDGHYETMDAAQLLTRMRKEEGAWKLILDVGRPKREVLPKLLAQLEDLCTKDSFWKEHLFLRLQTRYDVTAVQEAGLPVQVMFYIPEHQKREENGLTLESITKFCKKNGIRWVSMPKEALDEEVMAYLKKEKLKACVFSCNTYTETVRAAAMGTDWIATSHLSVRELSEWQEAKYTVAVRE